MGVSNKTLLKLARGGKVPGAAELDEGLWRFDEAWLRPIESVHLLGRDMTRTKAVVEGTTTTLEPVNRDPQPDPEPPDPWLEFCRRFDAGLAKRCRLRPSLDDLSARRSDTVR